MIVYGVRIIVISSGRYNVVMIIQSVKLYNVRLAVTDVEQKMNDLWQYFVLILSIKINHIIYQVIFV